MKKILVYLVTVTVFSAVAPVGAATAEIDLLSALQMNKMKTDRLAKPETAIATYKKLGLIEKVANRRVDYSDYYLVKKSVNFMGHDLILIEHEYLSAYIGCCASPGIAVTVKVVGEAKNIERFAKTNSCSFEDKVNLNEHLQYIGLKEKIPKDHYASLVCKEINMNN